MEDRELESFMEVTDKDISCPPLLPLEVMAKPLALRFRYHFEGDKQTNRLDKVRQFYSRETVLSY